MKKLVYVTLLFGTATSAVLYGLEVEERAKMNKETTEKLQVFKNRLYDTTELLDLVSRCAYYKQDPKLCLERRVNLRKYINNNYLNRF